MVLETTDKILTLVDNIQNENSSHQGEAELFQDVFNYFCLNLK